MIERLWRALGGDPRRATEVEVRRARRYLPSVFDVDGLAIGAVGATLLAAAELVEASGRPAPAVALDAEHVAVSFVSERHVRPLPPGAGWAPLSRFAETRDGWIRLHANYPHHRAALLTALAADEADALDAIAERDAEELETAIVDVGGAAAAMRTPEQWASHPQGTAVSRLPLAELGEPRAASLAGGSTATAPAAGIRVLDLTRVIAGPVATRTLAALGADVLRIDPPQSPELELSVRDGCVGKRLATLDFRADLATLHELLAGAHVLIHGYRPGALTAFGLDDAALAERHPHLTVASLSSWGSVGPWSDRRGFDSLVQSASGIAWREGAGADTDGDAGVRPGTLPAQALDHATGYLLAAAVLRSLACRRRGEESASTRFALAATAAELMLHPAPDVEAHAADAEPWLTALDGVTLVAPPGELSGHRLRWPHGPRPVAPGWPAG